MGEQLKVVASTNTLKRVFHEVRLGSLEKQKKPLLLANNRRCKLEFARRHQDWTIHDWYRVFFVMRLRSIDFNLMIALGVEWGMENLITSSSCEQDNQTWSWCNFVWGCMISHGMG